MADTPIFDIAAARADGVSDAAIANFLAPKVGFDLAAARKDGVDDAAIVDFLSPTPKQEPAVPEGPKSGNLAGIGKAAAQQTAKFPGAVVETVGSTAEVASLIDRANSRKQLDVFDRIDRGEKIKPKAVGGMGYQQDQDLIWANQYASKTPEERAEMRRAAEGAVKAPPDALQRTGESIRKVGEGMVGWAEKAIPLTPEEEGRTSVQVTKLLAGMVPYVAAAVGTGGAGLVGYGGLEALNRTYGEALKTGADPEKAAVAAVENGAMQGFINVVPAAHAAKILERLPEAAKGKFVQLLADAAMGSANMLTMTQVSQIAENAVASKTTEPNRPALQGVGENLTAPAIAGAILPIGAAAAGRAFRAKTPAEVAKPVMDAPDVDSAIAAAREVIDPVAHDVQAREFGGAADQQQAALLRLFGGLNEGTVEVAPDGSYHFRTETGGKEETIPLKVWEPGKTPPADGAEPTIAPALAAAQRAHYDKLGVKVVYFENDPGIPFDGAVAPDQPNTIFLSNNPTRNAAQIGAHEVTHLLESTKLPDGTNLGDLLHAQVREGVTSEGLEYAGRTFGDTAPERGEFPRTPEGDAAHADAIVSHLIRELGADIGGEAPKFQTFAPRVVQAVEARYGAEAAKGVLRKLLDGIQQTMRTLREFFSKPAEMAEYGQPETVSQKWVTNLEQIHDTLAKMYAERYATQAERENVALAEMRDRAQARRAEQERPVAPEVPPPVAPEGFTVPNTPERIGPTPPPAYGEAVDRATTLERWLGELDAKRRQDAEASPQAALLRQTEAAVLRKVKGVEDRLTKVGAERLRGVRQQLDALLNPTGDSADMVAVRAQLDAERQRMADAAAVGTGPAPATARAAPADPEGPAPPPAAPEPPRGRAVLPEPVPEAAPVRETLAPVAEAGATPAEPAAPPARERVMQVEAAAEVRRAVEEGGLPPQVIPEIAKLYRPLAGQDPAIAFEAAVNRWITVEEVKAHRAVGNDGVVTPEILKAVGDADPVLKEAFQRLEEHYTRDRNEIPYDDIPVREEPTRAPEAAGAEAARETVGRPEGEAPGGEPRGGGAVSDEASGVDALAATEVAATRPERAARGAGAGKMPPPEAITDAGEKIGGARKDRWAERGLRESDLEGMTEGEAFQNTTKDAVWPKPDYAAMVSGGMSPEAAALVKIIRDRLGARPAIDSAEGRRNYIAMMGHVREVLSEVKTKDDLRAARDRLVYDLAGVPRGMGGLLGSAESKAARNLLFSVYKGRQEPFRIGYAEQRKAEEMVSQGFPGKAEPWTRRYEIKQSGSGEFAVISKGERRVVDGQRFPTRDEAEAFAKATYENATEGGTSASLPKRPYLDSVQRTGADVRGGRDVNGDDFVNDFGFRGVEFGNWVKSDERARSVNLAYDALHDMAGVIGAPPKALSLDGQLGLAFGARGSGSAAAHYEPGRLVINLTKLSGSGSLAHEWGHALDHYFGTLDTGENTRGAPKGASGWYGRTEQRASYLKNLRPEMAQAFDGLMDAIFKREKSRAEAVRDAELRIENYQAAIDKQRERMEESKDPDFIKRSQTWIEQTKLQLNAAGRRLADLRDEEKPYIGAKINSSYYDEANKLSGKSGEKGYWSRPTEMFARAFESYVFDKIKAEGNESQYLVQGVEPERYASGYKGNPYPAADRPAINAAFDRLFETMDVREGKSGPALFSPKITGENKTREYTPEQRKAFENVGRSEEPFSLRNWIDGARQDLGKKFIREVLDPYIGVKESDPQGYLALRNANSTAAAVEAFKTHGTLKFEGDAYAIDKSNGGVADMLIKPLKSEAHDFIWWVAANRAERLKAEDRENLFSGSDITALKALNRGQVDYDYELPNGKTTRNREAIYMDSLRKLDVFNKNALDLAVESGLLKRGDVDAKWSNPFYVPFYRQAENDKRFVGPSITSGFVKQNAFKTLKGGSEKLSTDLWENAFGNWEHLIDASLRNKAAARVLDTAALPGVDTARKLTAQEANHLSDKEMKAKTVWVMENGEKVNYLVEDPFMFKAITALDDVQTRGFVMDAGRWFKKLLTVGVTSSPIFQLRNLIRDTEQSIAVSPLSLNVAKNLRTGFEANDLPGALENVVRAISARDLKNLAVSPEAANAMAGGALMRLNTGVDTGVSETRLGVMLNTPESINRLWSYVATVGKAYQKAIGQGEEVNRVALYHQLRAEGVPHDQASFAGRDLMDFTLRGASPIVRAITDLVPFMNAWMQGLYKVGRAASDSDKSVTGAVAGSITKRMAYVLGTMTMLTMALDAIYADDEDYKKRTEYDRNSNWWFKIGDTQFRIPMGFEMAAISRIASNGAEVFFDREMTGERFAKNFWSILGTNMSLNPIPQAVKPLFDIAENTSRTGSPIEPRGLERLRPEDRYTVNTTLISRGLSSAANAGLRAVPGAGGASGPSPIQIDYLVNAYGGWLATTVLGATDTVARSFSSEPVKPAADIWASATQGMISTQPTAQSRYVNMLYDQAKVVEQAFDSYRDKMRQGRVAEAKEFFEANKDLIQKHGIMSGVTRLEGDLNRQIRLIANNPDPDVSAEQKRVAIMRLTAVKNRAAQQAMEVAR